MADFLFLKKWNCQEYYALILIGIVAIITVITVGYESLKASLANPVTALKHE